VLDTGALTVDAHVNGAVAEVRIVGDLDLGTAETLVEVLDDLLGKDIDSICLDGSGLDFVDSAGLRAIVLGLVRATDAGVTYSVSDASEALDRVLSVTGLADLLGR
jgi:anti-sigma B factor antagonist